MAFFDLGDRYGEIECIAFSRTYSQISYKLKEDSAVLVGGYVQIREDEDIKFIVSSVELLQRNGEYHPKHKKNATEENNSEVHSTKAFGAPERQRKLYLRVPNLNCEEFLKAKNLVEIFEGSVEAIFYDSESKQYRASGLGFDVSEYTVKELKSLLGDENVVIK
jgi:DNA polymerase III alpha subunit